MTSGHVREPGAASAASSAMWRVVVPKQEDSSAPGNTLLSSELTPPPPPLPPPGAIAVTATSHYQHHHHWPPPPPHAHPHHHPYAIAASLAPQQQQQHGYGVQHQEAQDGQEQQQHHSARMSAKRQLSDSDCDDVFSEESGKEPCNSPGGDSCQHTSRKRRRGMIEKKRRDRINASLGELRRLVPAAARDPHSGKLEKAEILQLTVEHLRTLKNKGHEAGYDSTKLAMDYHAVGWGECAAEVGRYLVTMEGLDERDPLRLRLLSHLQSFHREQPPSQPQQQPQPQGHPQQQQQQQSVATANGPSGYEAQPSTTATTSSAALAAAASGSVQFHHQPPPTLAWPPSGAQYHHHHHHPGAAQYPVAAAAAAAQYAQQGHGKPYRPWGAELAY